MNNSEFLSKERIETTIRILEQVKNQGGELGLTHFSTLEVNRLEQVHPCGNTACIMGYVSLSEEWEAAGGATDRGRPRLKVPKNNYSYAGDSELASMWFTGKELNKKSLIEVQKQRTIAVVLSEAICLMLSEEYIEDLPDNVRDELHELLSIDRLERVRDLHEEIIKAITGKESEDVTIDDAIKALEWFLTLEITK